MTATRVTEAAARAADLQSAPAPKLPAILQTGEAGTLAARPLLYPPNLARALMAIRKAVQPVKKAGENTFHHYMYPKAEDVVDEVIPLLAEHGIFIAQSEITRSLFQEEHTLAITYEYVIFNADGEVWPDRPNRTGLAWVQDKKGTVDDKAANKCSTQSEKYFYIKFFGIRTSDAAQLDSDGNGGPASTPSPATAKRPQIEPPGPPEPPEPPQASGGSPPYADVPRNSPQAVVKAPEPPEPPAPVNEIPFDAERVDPDTGEITTVQVRPTYQLSTRGRDIPAVIEPAQHDKPTCHPAGFWVKRTPKGGAIVRYCSVCNSPEVNDPVDREQEVTVAITELVDEAQWLRDLEGAAGGCATVAELDAVQTKVMLPVKTTVSQASWSAARKVIANHARRVFEENE